MVMAMSLPMAVVIGFSALALTYVGYREYEHRRDLAEAKEVLRSLERPVTAVIREARVSPQFSSQTSAFQSRRLAANERCMGGTVIVVEGSSYSQTGERCNSHNTVP